MPSIIKDIQAVVDRDPAALNKFEVLLCYPSIHALIGYRIAHFFQRNRLRLIARLISQICRFFTGIEIHPGAVIGSGFFIDHGMGVVIGETCEIGDNVTLYQGVTLGGTGKDIGKRHPTVGSNVLIGAGAKVLGPLKIGDNSKIGAGSIVLKDVPEGCTVVGNPGRVVRCSGKPIESPAFTMNQIELPDPVEQELQYMRNQLNELTNRINNRKENN